MLDDSKPHPDRVPGQPGGCPVPHRPPVVDAAKEGVGPQDGQGVQRLLGGVASVELLRELHQRQAVHKEEGLELLDALTSWPEGRLREGPNDWVSLTPSTRPKALILTRLNLTNPWEGVSKCPRAPPPGMWNAE